jgi:hypothetical protein
LIHSIIHSVVCLMASPQPHPKRIFHTVRSTALTFNFQFPLISFRSSCSCLPLLPPISPSITCFKRQFLRKMWPTSSPSFFLLYERYSFPPSLCVTLLFYTTGSNDLLHPFPASHFKTFQVFIPEKCVYFCSRFHEHYRLKSLFRLSVQVRPSLNEMAQKYILRFRVIHRWRNYVGRIRKPTPKTL